MVFSVLFIALTIIGVWAGVHIHRSPNPVLNSRFHGLLAGVILIVGLSAASMPLLYNSKWFGQHVL
jgi:biotin transporter BioY